MKKILFNIAITILTICLSVSVFAQTTGTLTFTFTQVAHSPCYTGTKNVLAVWIQTNAGGFVKTKLRNAGSGTDDHLPTYAVNSGGTAGNCLATACNKTDATTGATLSSFGTKTIIWDGKNVNGTLNGTTVPDGVYKVTIQETWNHGTGSTVTKSYTFTKGSVADHQTPANDANFSGIKLDWVPDAGPVLTVSTSSVDVKCNGGNNGSATATANGTSPYTYSWNTSPVQTTQTATGLSSGTYAVTVKDGKGTTATSAVTVTQPTAIAITTTPVNIKCNGSSTGSVTTNVSGGTSGYTYLWNNGKVASSITGLSAGNYSLTVTDANGCTKNTSTTITQPLTAVTSNVSSTNANCGSSNGTAGVTASGGTGAYTYAWSNGKITTNVTGLSAGNYSITVTDANGCTYQNTVNVINAGAPTAGIVPTNVTDCFGGINGSATVTASGGTGGLTYSWNTNPVKTTTTVTGLSAGTYIVTVKDAAGCVVQVSTTITQPSAVTAIATPTDATSCSVNDGSIATSVSGGTSPYTYLWSNGKTTATITSLAPATYTLTITDNKGCTKAVVTTVNCISSILTVSTSTVDVKCNGGNNGTATATPSGTPPYTYSWSTSPVQTTQTATGLTAGNYIVVVTDASGSKATSVTITNPPTLVSNATPTNATSCSTSDGSIVANVSGGTSPYTYLWSNTKTTSTITGLAPGNYTLTVTDANGCKKITSQTINFAGAAAIPLIEDFESTTTLPSGWSLYNPDADAEWEVSTTVAHTGNNCIGFNNCDGNGSGVSMEGTKDRFITSAYDFTNANATASMSFDVAYALLSYKGQSYPDSLAVYASSDCGIIWNQIYLKGGSTLSTTVTTLSCWSPASSDWRTENINLSNYAGKSSVIFAFENRSDWGEWIYLDNININAITGITSINPLSGFSIYPNPATTSFTIEGMSRSEKINYGIFNVVGEQVIAADISTNGGIFKEKIEVNAISKGMYFITISDGKNKSTKKINIQ